MNKKILLLITIIILLILSILSILSIFLYRNYKIKTATIKVNLVDNLKIEVYSKVRLKDLIKNINGKLEKNFLIDTKKIGEQEIAFNYINEDNIKIPYQFIIEIVDTKPPIITSYKEYTIIKGTEDNVEKKLFCGDNYDNKPSCKIEGEYDINKVGEYKVKFIGKDSSNNISTKNITIKVKEKSNNINNNNITKTTNLEHIIKKHKNKKTKIGIDISHWQGNIDFKEVKKAGIEFVFIRVGSQKGIDGAYFIDKKFKENIEGFNKQNIPVGIYYYSYAKTKKDAKKEAKWVIKQIKKYDVDLPVVFDWENFSSYQEFNLSFYSLTEVAKTFLSEIEKAGYKGMLYSSKYYLEEIWYETKYPIWLAHYTEQTNYQGKYKVWQLCSNGKVPGVNELVDIDIMY